MTNDSFKSYVSITPYQGDCDITFDELELRTMYLKGRGVDIDVQPVHRDGWSVQCMITAFNTWEGSRTIKRIPMARKNAKQLQNIHADLVGMKDKIAELWNKRDFEGIKNLFN